MYVIHTTIFPGVSRNFRVKHADGPRATIYVYIYTLQCKTSREPLLHVANRSLSMIHLTPAINHMHGSINATNHN